MGDDVRLPDEAGSVSRGLKGAAVAQKRTLFQDMFGVSALVDVALKKSPQIAKSQGTWKGKEVEKILDTAAYLMPPLDTLFDTLMDGFLTVRSSHDIEEDDHEEDHADEMEVEGDDNLIVVGNSAQRSIGPAEMHAMVELFKTFAVRRTCYFFLCGLWWLLIWSSMCSTEITSRWSLPSKWR